MSFEHSASMHHSSFIHGRVVSISGSSYFSSLLHNEITELIGQAVIRRTAEKNDFFILSHQILVIVNKLLCVPTVCCSVQ